VADEPQNDRVGHLVLVEGFGGESWPHRLRLLRAGEQRLHNDAELLQTLSTTVAQSNTGNSRVLAQVLDDVS
jgi:hypothetical protein